MKTRSWLWLLVFSFAGYLATFLLFPKVMPAAHWQQKLDRQAAIVRAKEIARSLGVEKADSNDWIATVRIVYDHKMEHYLSGQYGSLGQGLFTPLKPSVQLIDPRTGRRVKVEMNSEGKPLLFEFSGLQDKKRNRDDDDDDGGGNKANTGQAEGVPDADKQMAESALKSLWGEKLSAAALAEASRTKQGSRLVWKASDQGLKLTAKALVREGKIATLSLERDYTQQFDAAFAARRGQAAKLLSGADALVIASAIVLVIIFYFLGLALKRVQHRQGLIFLGATFLLTLAVCLLTSAGEGIREGTNVPGNHYWLVTIAPWLATGFVALLIAGSLYFFWAAGQALEIRMSQRRTISTELILKGKVLTRPVAKSFAVGLLAGGIMVAIPILAAASRLLPNMELDSSGLEDHFASRFPAFSPFTDSSQYLLFIIFGFLAPLIGAFVKRPTLARWLIFAVCALGWMGTVFVYSSAWGVAVSGLLGAMVLTTVYLRDGLLAVLLSQTGAQAALGAAALLAQPSASLQSAGWRAVAGLAVMVVVSLVGVWKFREVPEEETAIPAHLLETRIERERLKAEFNVAQRAQQQMLPDAPPQIPGLEIAAVCKPSKEVGGDLYDFIPLPDGKLGVVVADVSGKGVPASLYMTLTKGLLASVSETASDPGEILREVNRHLYEVCRRKMFVTLFLGVIDPATKKMVYARAGHNPTVFRSLARQETSLLKPKGMGLGLNNGKVFNQSLKVETLQLGPNDKLFFYSDGITEAMNSVNEEYGEERLMQIAAKADGLAATEARDAVLADVTSFLGSNQPQDDQTLVVVKVV